MYELNVYYTCHQSNLEDFQGEAHINHAGKQRVGEGAEFIPEGFAITAQAGRQLSGTPPSGMISLLQVVVSNLCRM